MNIIQKYTNCPNCNIIQLEYTKKYSKICQLLLQLIIDFVIIQKLSNYLLALQKNHYSYEERKISTFFGTNA